MNLNHAALDVMLVFSFGKYLGHSAIDVQHRDPGAQEFLRAPPSS